MENATKALQIAGGVLLAILIIALLVRAFTNIKIFQKAKLSEEEQAEVLAFNEQYTKYIGQYVYGTEVRSLLNKYDDDKLVPVYITGSVPANVPGEVKYYKCVSITYNDTTGRVNSISFKEIQVTN